MKRRYSRMAGPLLLLMNVVCLHAMQSLQSIDSRTVTLFWAQKNFVAEKLQLKFKGLEDVKLRWKYAIFNKCNSHIKVSRFLGNYIESEKKMYLSVENGAMRYLEDYKCTFEERSQQPTWISYSLFSLSDKCACLMDRIKVIRWDDGAALASIDGLAKSMGVRVAENFTYFRTNKDFCLIPVICKDKSHVYLWQCIPKQAKLPDEPEGAIFLKFIADLGEFPDPQCGDINDQSTQIVIFYGNNQMKLLTLNTKGTNRGL